MSVGPTKANERSNGFVIGFASGFGSCLGLLLLAFCCYRPIKHRRSDSANLGEREEQGEELLYPLDNE